MASNEVNLKKVEGEDRVFVVSGIITVETGLHIGGGDSNYEVGGIDNPVIRDPEGYPYIPGSSLKGKLRSLLEIKYGLLTKEKYNENTEQAQVLRMLFGSFPADGTEKKGCLIFRDAHIHFEDPSSKPLPYKLIETKYENMIERTTGKAKFPRKTERVIRGTKFKFEIVVDLKSKDSNFNEKLVKNYLTDAFRLLEHDYLGGSGTRGYGKVSVSFD